MTYLTKKQRDELAKLAKDRTDALGFSWRDSGAISHDHYVGCHIDDADCDFIAAANPTVLQSLLAQIDRYEQGLKEIEHGDYRFSGDDIIDGPFAAIARAALTGKESK